MSSLFRPTPGLLFRARSAIPRLPRVHQYPVTHQESVELLDRLKSSLRRQLDQEHAYPSEVNSLDTPSPQRPRRHSTSEHTRSSHADRHLLSVLSNPLFNNAPGVIGSGNPRKNPMNIFNEGVARGWMDFEHATKCLLETKRQILSSQTSSVIMAMKESAAGRHVLQWLVSSGAADDMTFLQHERFTSVLFEFLVAEGHQEVAWRLVQRCLEQALSCEDIASARTTSPIIRTSVTALYHFIHAQASIGSTLDPALDTMVRAALSIKTAEISGQHNSIYRTLLYRSGTFLSNKITASTKPKMSPPAFESFVRIAPLFTKKYALYQARLGLCHPTSPSATPAMAVLRSYHSSVVEKDPASSGPSRAVVEVINLALDTTKLLLKYENDNDADWVLSFLQENFATELGVEQKTNSEQVHLLNDRPYTFAI